MLQDKTLRNLVYGKKKRHFFFVLVGTLSMPTTPEKPYLGAWEKKISIFPDPQDSWSIPKNSYQSILVDLFALPYARLAYKYMKIRRYTL